ncbi:acetyl xylan esterase [candidate division KSB1 bacterium]|nr:acetyl xylan esterase [candidate division KSB1 bacterium]
MEKHLIFIFFFSFLLFYRCSDDSSKLQSFEADNEQIVYSGRIDFSDAKKIRLSGSASYFTYRFKGTVCEVGLRDEHKYEGYNIMSVIIDGRDAGRIQTSSKCTFYPIARGLDDGEHTVMVSKATEAQNGYVEFVGLRCEKLISPPPRPSRKIEFIGNSITCGYGMNFADIPCDAGEWYSQHDAYYAYGPLIARELDADWLLSAVSGIGISRNWSTPGPTMPEVYHNTYMNTDSLTLWDFTSYVPDLVSICLGTNDFSDGGEKEPRVELDSTAFVTGYIDFVKRVRSHYHEATICLLTSPLLSGQKALSLKRYLNAVIHELKQTSDEDKIHLFEFSAVYASGCSGHPSKQEQIQIASQLLPFFKQVMNW